MKNIFLLLVISLCSCQPKEAAPTKPDAKVEIAKWKRQLFLNREVGTPCDSTNPEGWAQKNPEVYYGFPDSIHSKVFDENNDKINDILLYFPAGDCCSCSIGMNEGSDFVKLIYSDGKDFLTNDHLRTKIEQKIEDKFYEQTNTDVQRVVFTITDFSTDITGTYQLWTLEDPDCCAGIIGTFKYNPFSCQIEIVHQKNQ